MGGREGRSTGGAGGGPGGGGGGSGAPREESGSLWTSVSTAATGSACSGDAVDSAGGRGVLRTCGEEGHRGRSDRKWGSSTSPSKEEGPKGEPSRGRLWVRSRGGGGRRGNQEGPMQWGGAASLHSQGPGCSQPLCPEDHWWGRPLVAPEQGVLPAGLRRTLGCVPEPDGLPGCVPPPPPPRQQHGVELTRGQAWGPVQSPPCLPLRFQFLLPLEALPPPPLQSPLHTFPRDTPISSTWVPGLEQAGERQVLLRRPRELAGHHCWGWAP